MTCGYCTVAAPMDGAGMSVLIPRLGNTVRTIVPPVMARPLNSPGMSFIRSSYTATLRTPVTTMLARAIGMRNFHASFWS